MRERLIRAVPMLAWMAFIFAMSSREAFPQPFGVSTFALSILAHLVLYGILGVLAMIALVGWDQPNRTTHLAAIAIAALYGVSDEFHQSFVPGRDASILDLVVNTIGATLAVTIWARRSRIVAAVLSR